MFWHRFHLCKSLLLHQVQCILHRLKSRQDARLPHRSRYEETLVNSPQKLNVFTLVLVSTFTLIEKVEGCIIVEPYPQRRNTQKYSIHMSKCNLSVREQEGGAVGGVAGSWCNMGKCNLSVCEHYYIC